MTGRGPTTPDDGFKMPKRKLLKRQTHDIEDRPRSDPGPIMPFFLQLAERGML